jgi:DNA polymerase III alpha subunit
VDIESGRREEAIQHVYGKYGRHHTAQVANVISYRPKSAVRDIAKAFGYSQGQQDAWSKQIDRWGSVTNADVDGIPREVVTFANELLTFPRHLGIHSGGMVICDRPVIEVCPVEWARMENRSVLQWDKDDCAAVALVKFDLLGLGMLSALHYAVDFVDPLLDLGDFRIGRPGVYEMLCRADAVGVFRAESAQMATLPWLKPREFYDLAVGGADRPADSGWVGHPTSVVSRAREADATAPLLEGARAHTRCSALPGAACRWRSTSPASTPRRRTCAGHGLEAIGRPDGPAQAAPLSGYGEQRHHR